jgi:hypothetical protein
MNPAERFDYLLAHSHSLVLHQHGQSSVGTADKVAVVGVRS